jgi:D-amino-acid dehydrogenase
VEAVRCIVIGAGIAGSSAAYELARAGAEVVVLDDGQRGAATGAGAGIVAPVSPTVTSPDWTPDVFRAVRHYPAVRDALCESGATTVDAFGYRRTGELVLADDEQEAALDGLAKRVDGAIGRHGEHGIGQPRRLSAKELRDLVPWVAPGLNALWLEGVACVDGRAVRAALLSGAQRHGATVNHGHARIAVSHGKVVGAWLGERFVPSDAVVCAAGAWAGDPGFGSLPVRPVRGQLLHLSVPGRPVAGSPILATFRGHYALGFPGDRLVVGATAEPDAGFDVRPSARSSEDIRRQACRIVPELAEAPCDEVRVG